jgi:hypothetical protein
MRRILVCVGAVTALTGCAELLGLQNSYTHGTGGAADNATSSMSTGGSGGTTGTGGAGGAGGSAMLGSGWPDSATAFCMDPSGTLEIDCSATPAQDGSRTDLVAPSYTLAGNTQSTVYDEVTGLRWTRYDQGNRYLGDAADTCAMLRRDAYPPQDGYPWRLPSRIELHSLVDNGSESSYSGPFEGLLPNAIWTTTEDPTDAALQVTIASGGAISWPKDNMALTLCVSGELPPSELVLGNAGDTVWDPRTLLMWEQGPGEDWRTWLEALTRCEQSTLAGFDDWRLPTRKEFSTIVDDEAPGEPYIRVPLALGSQLHYWTSTPSRGESGKVVVHGFYGVGAYTWLATEPFPAARCVRSSSEP